MKKLVKNLLAVSAICCSVGSFSQSSADAVLMTIDGKPVTKSEFETVFLRTTPAEQLLIPNLYRIMLSYLSILN